MIFFIEDRDEKVKIHMERCTEVEVKQRCLKYLDQLCQRFGSTFEGRRRSASTFLHIRQHVPVMIHSELMVFPSVLEESQREIWINYHAVSEVKEEGYQTRVRFMDGSELLVGMDYRSALKQIRRCAHYVYALQLHHQVSENEFICCEI